MERPTKNQVRKGPMKPGQNGKNYFPIELASATFHATLGNSKVGNKVGCYNIAIEYTCMHDCDCYKSGKCYACQGCYNFQSNQQKYTENFKYYMENDAATLAGNITEYIVKNNLSLFRYFTCGDIPGRKFMETMVKVALDNPSVKFWAYTKKYHIVNRWIDENGKLPENLVIIFSHWLNDDGTYYPMENPHNMPTSEFIPLGKEELTKTVTHICPCSDPNVKATCATCDHHCYNLKPGESMALLEHSTQRTKERDRAIKAAHEKL